MARIKRGNVARKRRNKILLIARGYKGAHSSLFRLANQQIMKAFKYSYIGRKQKKRIFRRIWIMRINAAARFEGMPYSKFIETLKTANINLNRKILAQLSIIDYSAFSEVLRFSTRFR